MFAEHVCIPWNATGAALHSRTWDWHNVATCVPWFSTWRNPEQNFRGQHWPGNCCCCCSTRTHVAHNLATHEKTFEIEPNGPTTWKPRRIPWITKLAQALLWLSQARWMQHKPATRKNTKPNCCIHVCIVWHAPALIIDGRKLFCLKSPESQWVIDDGKVSYPMVFGEIQDSCGGSHVTWSMAC